LKDKATASNQSVSFLKGDERLYAGFDPDIPYSKVNPRPPFLGSVLT
jgi:hypothetical protein